MHTGSYVDPTGSPRAVRRRDAPGARGAAAGARGASRATTPRGCCWSRPPARAGRCAPASTTSAPYLDALDHHPKAGICLDTCHVFAAGAPLDEPGGATATVDRIVEIGGPGRLRLVHANDSMDVRGAFKDRHQRIGEGHIGDRRVPRAASPTRRPTGCRSSWRRPGSRDAGNPRPPAAEAAAAEAAA